MTDRPDAPEKDLPEPAATAETAAPALPPRVWVTGLIVLVVLLLAGFALA